MNMRQATLAQPLNPAQEPLMTLLRQALAPVEESTSAFTQALLWWKSLRRERAEAARARSYNGRIDDRTLSDIGMSRADFQTAVCRRQIAG